MRPLFAIALAAGCSLLLFRNLAASSAPEVLQWESGPGYRSAPLAVPKVGRDGFVLVPGSESGIRFTNTLAKESGARSQLRLAGSGVAAGDVDGDGLCDLYFCGMEAGNRLYRNLGNWHFQDITDEAGVRCPGQFSTGAVLADVDGDGTLDLLVNSIGGGTRLFLNDGKGHFTEATDRGLIRKFGATTMALADVDGNGTLDLYVANNNSPTSLGDEPNTRFTIQVDPHGRPTIAAVNGRPVAGTELEGRYTLNPSDSAIREYGQPDVLYLNDGHGHFTQVSWTNGVFSDEAGRPLSSPPRDLGLSVMFHDMDGDGAPDIYVCDDLWTPDRIWLNDGHGHFRAMSREALPNTCAFSMGVDFADINRDGHDDFLVTDMLSQSHRQRMIQVLGQLPFTISAGEKNERTQVKRNVLQLNRGDGTYAEIAQLSGLEGSEWSWATLFLDVDLDGYEDVLVAAGYDRDSMNGDVDAEIRKRKAGRNLSADEIRNLGFLYPPVPSPIIAFRNLGNLHFRNAGHQWGFDRVTVNQGICCADLDNDGDLDLIVNNLHDEAGVYRNECTRPRVAVRLKGEPANTRGIGAKIWLYGGAVPMQSQEMICGGRYLSCDDAMRVFAAGTETNRMRLEVRWRGGKRSVVEGVQANRIYEIAESGATGLWPPRKPDPPPMFEDVSDSLKHTHRDAPFDDFQRQPLLPRKLSQLGPGVAWSDVDGDGHEDLLIGGGNGSDIAIFLNRGKGSFQGVSGAALLGTGEDDQTTLLGRATDAGSSELVVGRGSYVRNSTNCVKRFALWAGGVQGSESLYTGADTIGPLALGDLKGDGNLELFVGGRVRPGRWPEPPRSTLFRKQKGKYVLDAENTAKLEQVGMVSGAVWSDLDGDGFPELILACEWGPLRIFQNNHGQLSEWDPPVQVPGSDSPRLNLSQLTGWWNGVTVGDFDGDGRLDIVASNWGSNSKYERARQGGQPLRLYYGDWNGDGTVEMLEGFFDSELKKIVPWKVLTSVARALPWVQVQYPTHAAYSVAGVADILGDHFKDAKVLEARWPESTVFLNRGDHFEAVVLPGEAQFAPAFGVTVGDMGGDGHEDIFLSQNFFGVDDETTRYDAGRAVWLRGNGHGQFTVVPGQVSGVKVYGEGRGCALCDYDEDGRVDLVVAQNNAETKLYHNVGAKPGLRVRLAGPPGNPTAIGAVIRLRFGDDWGPAREVHAGSGYWSQDSAVQVLGTPKPPTSVWVRWPGGKVQEDAVPPGATEVRIAINPAAK